MLFVIQLEDILNFMGRVRQFYLCILFFVVRKQSLIIRMDRKEQNIMECNCYFSVEERVMAYFQSLIVS